MRHVRHLRSVVLLWVGAWCVAAVLLLAHPGGAEPPVVNDVTLLNPIAVDRVVAPESIEEVRLLVRGQAGPISMGGARHSMGGQIATEGALFLDMRELDEVLAFSPQERTVTVEAGISWRQIQEVIDPHDLSILIMQSYANFTVGGSLSVNAHGRYVNQGPLIRSVRSIQLVLADGTLVRASPDERPDLFYGAIGGYGGLGVIVSATLDLATNERVERTVEKLNAEEYPSYFQREIAGAKRAVFHNADLYPPTYDSATAITFSGTDRDVTVKERLRPTEGRHTFSRLSYDLLSRVPFAGALRQRVLDPLRLRGRPVVWRNYEASYDTEELDPSSPGKDAYVLQEYFVPIGRFEEFRSQMAEIFQRYDVNVLNVSVRHAHADPGTFLAWASEECFAFVIYYNQGVETFEQTEVGVWTRELIDAALSVGGTFYLPYQIHATDEQFHRGYPRASELFQLKRDVDPTYKFRNKLWDRYSPPPRRAAHETDELRERLREKPGYPRREEQTYLTLPEWYVVYSADEQAAFLEDGWRSEFPYFRSVGQFWSVYSDVRDLTRERYPYNAGYEVVIATVGGSLTAEYVLVGAYEGTVGRLTEWLSLRGSGTKATSEDRFFTSVAAEYAAFIHEIPWYEFPFWTKTLEFWSPRGGSWAWPGGYGREIVRKVERRIRITAELLFKAGYAGLIRLATTSAYAPQDLEILAWVQAGAEDPEDAYPGVRVVDRFDDGSILLAVPRYQNFTLAMPELLRGGVRFIEIAGNEAILVTAIAPAAWDPGSQWGEILGEWEILTAPERKRVALTVPVSLLHEVLPGLASDGIEVDHLYDY